MEDPTNTFIIKTSSPIHFNDAKGALSGGDRAVVGVPNIGSDEGQVAGLVGGFGPAGIRAFPGRSQVLDIQIDRGAAQALFQQGLYRPSHGGVHAGFRYFPDGDPYSNPYKMTVLTEGLGPPALFQEEGTAQPIIYYSLNSDSYILTGYSGPSGIFIAFNY